MRVHSADIVISAVSKKQYPTAPMPEIALAGRSNVGKSSFINTMIQRKNLARTSGNPGKTQTLNFYIINDSFHFVDVPGYGYAKVSKTERARWGKMMDEYFGEREQLVSAVLVVDLRHEPSDEDCMMYDYFKYYDLPVTIIATKMDKVKKAKRSAQEKLVREVLDVEEEDPLIMFSSETGEGKEEAWKSLRSHLKM